MSLTTVQIPHTQRLQWRQLYPVLCLVSLSIAPAIFLGEGNRNLALIFFMLISPLFALKRSISMEGLFLLSFAFSITVFPAIIYGNATRWSTVFYSLMFCVLFLSYDAQLRGGRLGLKTFLNIIRYIIFAYTIVLVIQQICVALGLPIVNLSNYDPRHPWKLNSLSAEPSHSARIVALLMLSHIIGSRILSRMDNTVRESVIQNMLLWLSFFWTILTMYSATAIVMLVIVLLVYIQKNNIRNYVIFTLLSLFLILALPNELTSRVMNLALGFLTLDYEQTLRADHSGSMRVVALLVLLNYVEVFSFEGLFGNGVDSVRFFLSDYIWGVREGTSGGGLMAVWYEYGFISFFLFVLFSLKATAATSNPANFLIWFIMIFIAGVNSQMVWLTIVLLYTLNFYLLQAKRISRDE